MCVELSLDRIWGYKRVSYTIQDFEFWYLESPSSFFNVLWSLVDTLSVVCCWPSFECVFLNIFQHFPTFFDISPINNCVGVRENVMAVGANCQFDLYPDDEYIHQYNDNTTTEDFDIFW